MFFAISFATSQYKNERCYSILVYSKREFPVLSGRDNCRRKNDTYGTFPKSRRAQVLIKHLTILLICYIF